MIRTILIALCISWGADVVGDLARRRPLPRPPTDCPDCRPAIRSALVARADVNSSHGY